LIFINISYACKVRECNLQHGKNRFDFSAVGVFLCTKRGQFSASKACFSLRKNGRHYLYTVVGFEDVRSHPSLYADLCTTCYNCMRVDRSEFKYFLQLDDSKSNLEVTLLVKTSIAHSVAIKLQHRWWPKNVNCHSAARSGQVPACPAAAFKQGGGTRSGRLLHDALQRGAARYVDMRLQQVARLVRRVCGVHHDAAALGKVLYRAGRQLGHLWGEGAHGAHKGLWVQQRSIMQHMRTGGCAGKHQRAVGQGVLRGVYHRGFAHNT
jgi:hypothetical protein